MQLKHYLAIFRVMQNCVFGSECKILFNVANIFAGEPGDTEDEETFRYFKKDDIPKELYMAQYTCEGCLKRKTLLKNGKKPAVRL